MKNQKIIAIMLTCICSMFELEAMQNQTYGHRLMDWLDSVGFGRDQEDDRSQSLISAQQPFNAQQQVQAMPARPEAALDERAVVVEPAAIDPAEADRLGRECCDIV